MRFLDGTWGGGLAHDDDILWVAGGNDAGGVIDRIDATTNRVVDAIRVDGDLGRHRHVCVGVRLGVAAGRS